MFNPNITNDSMNGMQRRGEGNGRMDRLPGQVAQGVRRLSPLFTLAASPLPLDGPAAIPTPQIYTRYYTS